MTRLRLCVALLILCCLTVLSADAAVSHAVGYRLWLADWDSLDSDLGSSELHMLYYNLNINAWGLLILGGTGDGWEGESSRLDIQGTLTRTLNVEFANVMLGAGYHYIDFEFDSFGGFGGVSSGFGSGYSTFHGPELGVSVYKAVGTTGLGGYATATVLPVVFWEYNEAEYDVDDNDGTTLGYSFDAGVAYSYGHFSVSGGYKLFALTRDDGGSSLARSLVDESFSGIYFQAGAGF